MKRSLHTFNNNSRIFFRSCLFYCGMFLSTLIWGPVVLLSWPLPFEQRYSIAQYWSRFNLWWLSRTCNINSRITGLEHLPHDRPAIILAKHQSTWETLFLHQLLPPQAIVVKRELLRIPLFGWCLALLNPIAIEREAGAAAIRQVLREGKRSLDSGRWVVLFPEGTRTAPGERKPYGASGAKLAAHSGYPIVPLAHNAGEFWPRRGFVKRPGTIHVVFGPIISVNNRKAKELNELTEHWIEETMETIGRSRHSTVGVSVMDTLQP